MIRWKAGLMWTMAALDDYEYVWSLDTDAFILGPMTYDVHAEMFAETHDSARPPSAPVARPVCAGVRADGGAERDLRLHRRQR